MKQYDKTDTCNIIDKELVKPLLPERPENSNKGTFGRLLNFSGCREYVGAAYLSSKSAARVGTGLVELAAPLEVREKIACMIPDIIYSDVRCKNYLHSLPGNIDISKYTAVLIGCGLGLNCETAGFIKKFLKEFSTLNLPIVYDADALNIIAQKGVDFLGRMPVITPHPGEMARLMGVEVADVQSSRVEYALSAAKKYNTVTVLKGFHTIIASPNGEVFKDVTGSNALARAGMGDVLAGIIAGYCAQGLKPLQASILGVYVHSAAGVYGEKEFTSHSLLASDMLNFIPEAIKSVIV